MNNITGYFDIDIIDDTNGEVIQSHQYKNNILVNRFNNVIKLSSILNLNLHHMLQYMIKNDKDHINNPSLRYNIQCDYLYLVEYLFSVLDGKFQLNIFDESNTVEDNIVQLDQNNYTVLTYNDNTTKRDFKRDLPQQLIDNTIDLNTHKFIYSHVDKDLPAFSDGDRYINMFRKFDHNRYIIDYSSIESTVTSKDTTDLNHIRFTNKYTFTVKSDVSETKETQTIYSLGLSSGMSKQVFNINSTDNYNKHINYYTVDGHNGGNLQILAGSDNDALTFYQFDNMLTYHEFKEPLIIRYTDQETGIQSTKTIRVTYYVEYNISDFNKSVGNRDIYQPLLTLLNSYCRNSTLKYLKWTDATYIHSLMFQLLVNCNMYSTPDKRMIDNILNNIDDVALSLSKLDHIKQYYTKYLNNINDNIYSLTYIPDVKGYRYGYAREISKYIIPSKNAYGNRTMYSFAYEQMNPNHRIPDTFLDIRYLNTYKWAIIPLDILTKGEQDYLINQGCNITSIDEHMRNVSIDLGNTNPFKALERITNLQSIMVDDLIDAEENNNLIDMLIDVNTPFTLLGLIKVGSFNQLDATYDKPKKIYCLLCPMYNDDTINIPLSVSKRLHNPDIIKDPLDWFNKYIKYNRTARMTYYSYQYREQGNLDTLGSFNTIITVENFTSPVAFSKYIKSNNIDNILSYGYRKTLYRLDTHKKWLENGQYLTTIKGLGITYDTEYN